MATTSIVKSLSCTINWDKTWASRPNSGSGILWKAYINGIEAGADTVQILNPTAQNTIVIFKNPGTYVFRVFVSDGAMKVVSDPKTVVITEDDPGGIDVTLGAEPITIPVYSAIPESSVFEKLDVVFDIDATNSMQACIDTIKNNLSTITQKIKSKCSNSEFALSTFMDINHTWRGIEKIHPYVTKIWTDLTDSSITIGNYLNQVSIGHGGDWNEANVPSIYRSASGISWRDGSQRIYFHLTDAAGHYTRDGVTLQMAVNSLKENNIKFIGICLANSTGYPASTTGSDDVSSGIYHPQAVAELVNFFEDIIDGNNGNGTWFSSNKSANNILSVIDETIKSITTDLTVKLTAEDAPDGLIQKITPSEYSGMNAGDNISFDVTFGSKNAVSSIPSGGVDFKLVISTNDGVVIARIPCHVNVS